MIANKLLSLLAVLYVSETETQEDVNANVSKIAIIGAGIGGGSTAYFLNELLRNKGKHFEIDIFEKSAVIGGRLATVKIEDDFYEAGGTIIHERNHYASLYAKLFGLSRRSDFLDNQKLCILNGTVSVFCESNYQSIDIIKGLWRYGMDLVAMKKKVNKVLDDFERIYQLQDHGHAFDSLELLLESMNPSFVNFTKQKYGETLQKEGYRNTFINEILQSITLVNYGQTVNIPSFVGYVSFAGAGGELWSIRGGNKQLPQNFIADSGANIRKLTTVDQIVAMKNGKYRLVFREESGSKNEIYDYVIIAAPMTHDSNIQFVNFDDDLNKNFDNLQMHHTKATFVKATLLPKNENYSFLSCNDNNFATSIAQVLPVSDVHSSRSRIFKVFSGPKLNEMDLLNVFADVETMTSVDWKAYPEYSGLGVLPRFKLAKGVYHVNAIEWAASAMEMSMIGAKNVALLTCQDMGLCPRPEPTGQAVRSDL